MLLAWGAAGVHFRGLGGGVFGGWGLLRVKMGCTAALLWGVAVLWGQCAQHMLPSTCESCHCSWTQACICRSLRVVLLVVLYPDAQGGAGLLPIECAWRHSKASVGWLLLVGWKYPVVDCQGPCLGSDQLCVTVDCCLPPGSIPALGEPVVT